MKSPGLRKILADAEHILTLLKERGARIVTHIQPNIVPFPKLQTCQRACSGRAKLHRSDNRVYKDIHRQAIRANQGNGYFAIDKTLLCPTVPDFRTAILGKYEKSPIALLEEEKRRRVSL